MKKFLLFLMFALFCIPWAANAQNRTLVTIGDGTSTQRYPLPGYFGYQYDVFIYTPTAAPALEADCDISSIAFNVSTNNTDGESTMKIWVKDVDADYALAAATTFDDYTADAELVYENDDFSSTTGWNTFDFTRDFSHQGGKALLVAVRGEGCGTSACSRQCTYTTASNTYWNKHQDNSDPGTNVSGTLSSNRANIQLDLTYTGAVCLTPSGLTYTNVVENAATLSWTENGEGTAWVLEYSTANDYAGATTVNVSGTPTTSLSGLSALTTYYIRVKADCGSDWLTGSFTTTAHAETVGNAWADDFEGTNCGWELINGTNTNAWAWGTATNNGGTHAIYVSNDGGTTNAYNNGSAAMVYATKLLNFADGKYEFSYDWNGNGESNYDYLRVALVPASVTLTAGTSTPSGFSYSALPTGWIALDGGSKLNQVTAWQSKTATINVTAGNYYMVLAWRNDSGGGTNPPAAVDNVSINRVACPYVVEDLETLQIWTTSALLFWSRDGGEDWQVAYADNANFDNAIYENFTSQTSYTITNLTPATTYYVKMRAHCGGEDFGSWSEVLQFNTKCEAMDLANEDFTENFDGITVASTYSPSTRILPICWSYINTSTYASNAVYPTIYYYSYTDYSNSTPNSLRFYSSYSNYSSYDPQDEYAILPAMENLAGKQITLWIRGYNATTPFKVGMITDPTDASTFVEITNDANPSLSTSYQEFTYIIPADATANYVAIMMEAANSSNSTRGLYIDDIKIADAPTCAKPTELEATADALTATITWMSEVGEYEVAYSTDNTANPDENIAGTATEETYTMNDLALGDHYFWVRANCGSDGYSEWVGPVSVHIGYCVPTPSNVDGNGISNVTFGMGDNIVNNDTPKATYADYSSQIGAVQAGVESTIAITYATGYTYGTIIWVDLDNSLSFEDSEIVYTGTSESDNPTTLNAAITIPATVTPGDYMMRIGGADSGFDSYISGSSTTAPSACYTGNWACFQDYTLRVLEAPSCLLPTHVAINYTGGNTATVTWEGTAQTYNIDVNGTVTNNVTTPYTLGNLEMATTYAVKVQANCEGDETSEWTEAVSFTTDPCMPENQCEITFELTDNYSDGWNGAAINVVDVLTNTIIATMSADNHGGGGVESTDTKTLAVCDGREIQFVWVSGSYDDECSYVVKDANGEVIFFGQYTDLLDEPVNYVVNCAAPGCGKILVDAQNPEWSEDFEGYDVTTTLPERWTGVLPTCWTVPVQYTGTIDTLPQVYQGFNTTDEGQYTLRMHFRYLLAMPELDETVDLGKVRLNLNVRQPYYKYKLQIGVITDMDNPETSFVPVAVVNNSGKDMTNFECGFASVSDLVGEGRHIAFKNIGGSANDLYCTNYLDDITLTYVNVNDLECEIYPEYEETFESYMAGAEPNCWEVITEDVPLESTTRPQVYGGFNTTAGGSKTLRLKNRCVYAMPEFIEGYSVSDFTMTFNLRQPKSIYRLQVGLVDEQGEFHALKTFKCNTTDMQEMTMSFADYDCSVGSRVAFRNTLVPGTGRSTDYLDYSINYIDDINLTYEARGRNEFNANAFEAEGSLEDIAVYPNPTTGNLYIDAIGIQKVECYNQMGQLVRVYDNVRNSIDLNNLSEGVYTLRITVPQGVTMRKVVKK